MAAAPLTARAASSGPSPGAGPAAGPGPGRPVAAVLPDVTFAVVDLETTGTCPGRDRIIEVAAARYRGGRRVATFRTLVNPGCDVPPFIAVLTGITGARVAPAPPVAAVLPALVEFLRGCVLVGHNVRFDTSFLDAALACGGRPPLGHRRVDTLTLARRFVGGELADLRLATLARHFGTATAPSHRALDDVLATAEVFHRLLERATAAGVATLDDLLALGAPAAAPGRRRGRLRRWWRRLPLPRRRPAAALPSPPVACAP